MSSERQLLEEKSPWWGEHWHRYKVVLPYLSSNPNAAILDIACGTGFGTHLLAQHTQGQVIGGDIMPTIIDDCCQYWQLPNLSFEVIDATKMPFADHTFDFITSFETIEHTTEYNTMLAECRRVLKPNGTAFISTPNFPVNSPTGKILNPYHTQEFDYNQLSNLLKAYFGEVQILGQVYARYHNRHTLRFGVAQVVEKFFYQRGIRKLPLSWQDTCMQALIGTTQYPKADDYKLCNQQKEVLLCKTFFAICQP